RDNDGRRIGGLIPGRPSTARDRSGARYHESSARRPDHEKSLRDRLTIKPKRRVRVLPVEYRHATAVRQISKPGTSPALGQYRSEILRAPSVSTIRLSEPR